MTRSWRARGGGRTVQVVRVLRSRRVRAAAIATAIAAATGSVGDAGLAQAPAHTTLRVALYGDSIGAEIAGPLRFLLRADGFDVVFDENTFGGTNACDWLVEARDDARTFRPDVVVTLFIGNDMTDCMHPGGRTLSPVEVARRTVADTNALATSFPDALVLRVGGPRSRADQASLDDGGSSKPDLVNALLARSVAGHLAHVDGGLAVYRAGRYADTLPCATFDGDCVTGRVTVRSPDGVHLCPAAPAAHAGVLPACAVESPGATRIAMVVAGTIDAAVSR